MELTVFQIFELLIVFVSLLFAGFLFSVKTENYTSNLLMAFFLILNAQDSGGSFISGFVYPNYPGWGMLINSTVLLIMPVLYLYIQSVIYSDFRLKWRDLWHGLPFLLNFLVFIPHYYSAGFEEKWIFLHSENFHRLLEIRFTYIILHLQIAAYLIICFLNVRKYKKLLLENYSNADMFHYNWLYQLLLILAIGDIVASLKNVFLFMNAEEAYSYSLLASSLLMLGLICWMVLKALGNPDLFRGIDSGLQLVKDLTREQVSGESHSDDVVSYQDAETREKIEKLEKHMAEQEPYLDASLSVYDLSRQLEIPVRELSLLINHVLDQHFFDFVNGFRIKKAMDILRDPDKKEFTVLEILYEVGFNSKSSFNTAFKKYARLTPTEYRRKHLKSIS
ncbi:MAG: helix-turn-helix transcriptional regulator [Lewinellaceae bacterium]|nr:helix-turn-helix transcriptional regulator [Lewinellaceae bacterium]